MEKYELTIEGMSCTGCEETVTNAAKQVDGVYRVEADYESDTVEITAEEASEDDIKRVIYDAGYNTRE